MSNGSSSGVPSLTGSRDGSRDGAGEGNLFYAYAKRVCYTIELDICDVR